MAGTPPTTATGEVGGKNVRKAATQSFEARLTTVDTATGGLNDALGRRKSLACLEKTACRASRLVAVVLPPELCTAIRSLSDALEKTPDMPLTLGYASECARLPETNNNDGGPSIFSGPIVSLPTSTAPPHCPDAARRPSRCPISVASVVSVTLLFLLLSHLKKNSPRLLSLFLTFSPNRFPSSPFPSSSPSISNIGFFGPLKTQPLPHKKAAMC